jgi:hypothetical protein
VAIHSGEENGSDAPIYRGAGFISCAENPGSRADAGERGSVGCCRLTDGAGKGMGAQGSQN